MQNDTQSNIVYTPSSDDGYIVGKAATDTVGFYGTTPIVQRTGAAQAAVVTTGTTSSSPFGFTSAAQGDAIIALVNELRAAMVAVGLISGAA
jgi:UDP-N-acetyl-D-mannosaminuronic acid transferase (WecB/TagA/CpsF family)